MEAITENQRVKSPCSSSLSLGTARAELTKLLRQRCLCCSPGTHFPPFLVRVSQPHPSPFGGSCTHPAVPCTRHWGSSLFSMGQGPMEPCSGDPLAMSKLLGQHQPSLGREIKILFQASRTNYSDILTCCTVAVAFCPDFILIVRIHIKCNGRNNLLITY